VILLDYVSLDRIFVNPNDIDYYEVVYNEYGHIMGSMIKLKSKQEKIFVANSLDDIKSRAKYDGVRLK